VRRLALSSDARARRRFVALATAAFVALATGMEVGGRSGDAPVPAPAAEQASRRTADEAVTAGELSLAQQAGQLVILRFDGTSRPDYVREALDRGRATGVILFSDNVASPGQLRGLTRSLQEAAAGSALIATDQEGGSIRIVPFAAPEASPGSLTEPSQAERVSRQGARDLARLGINVNLAPIADLATRGDSVMAGRAYSGDPEAVAEMVEAAIRGSERGGVAATAKHFPGIGSATRNTDDASVTIERDREELDQAELVPFRAAVAADSPLMMAGHALYPELDEERIASQSPAVLGDLLRDELGYDGAIVTDSMEAQAVLDRSSTPEASVRSVEAGADLLLTTSTGSYFPVYKRLMREAERSPEFAARVEEAADRVLELKRRLGLEAPAPE
jgi:beta-N-acetylhexosaminidase